MDNNKKRLFFIDAMRAWAILMMLQGHFIDGLLDNAFRDNSNVVFNVWKYFRGITAPVFFTVSGFIFTYLLIRVPETGFNNPRVKKGIKRGLELIFIGYLLRVNVFGLFIGELYDAFYVVDVLHCIGFSILGIVAIYILASARKKYLFPLILFSTAIILFTLEPLYADSTFAFLPRLFANYFTKINGSVFTIIPWFGYAAFGGFLSIVFKRYKDAGKFYPITILVLAISGLLLIFTSSPIFLGVSEITGIQLFAEIQNNNYLFIRLGDVLVIFSIFMLFRQFMNNKTILQLGQSTLSIYIIHFIILYGSFTGLGVYRFLNHSVSPIYVILGAILFMIACSFLALQYEKHKSRTKALITQKFTQLWSHTEPHLYFTLRVFKVFVYKFLRFIRLLKN